MQTLFQDLRYGSRMLAKNPGFTAIAVLTIAIGIGATTAVFSLVDNVLLKMLPVKAPEELVLFANVGGFSDTFSYPHYRQFRDQNQVFSGVTGFALTDLAVTVDGKAELAQGQFVSGNYFSVLGVSTILGRPITDEDDRVLSGHPGAVISSGYWQRKFGGDPSVLGRTITLQGYPFTIIGVLPHGFFGLEIGDSPDISIPVTMRSRLDRHPSYLNDAAIGWLQIVARRKPGVSQAEAQASASVIYQQLKDDTLRSLPPGIPPQLKQMILETKLDLKSASRGLNQLRDRFSRPLLILMAAAVTMLLIACSNVPNLMLARSTARRREFAVRCAIGAGGMRLIQQLLTESLMLATIGGLLGVLIAHWIGYLLLALVSSGSTPVLLNLHLDYRLLTFAVAASLFSAVLFGLWPALKTTRVSPTEALKHQTERTDGHPHHMQSGKLLVISQVALSVVLLIGAGLLFRTLQNLRNLEAGFDRSNVLLFSMNPGLSGYKDRSLANLYSQVVERLATIPIVTTASASRFSPAGGNYWINIVSLDGYAPRPNEDMQVEVNPISPEFFKTLGIPLLVGRSFGPEDNENSPKVAVINETMAHHFFGGDNPIGRRIGFGPSENRRQIEIVGLVKDAKYGHLREPVKRMVYVPYQQEWLSEMTFSVRTQGNSLGIVPEIRRQVQAIDKDLPLFGIKTLNVQIEESLVQERMIGTLLNGAGFLAFLIACMGLYGLLSYSVARRTSEIGVRMALGARPREIFKLVLGQGVTLTLLGVLIGVVTAFGLTRFLTNLLYGVSPVDPTTYIMISLLFITVISLACYIPARRAAGVDPMVALRYE